MKVEVRFTTVSPLPKNGVFYELKTRIILLKEGTYRAVASIDYKIENGAVVASSGDTGSTTRLILEATARGGLCRDTTTLKSGFAKLFTWDFSLAGQFPNKDHTVTVDGHKGQFSHCESGATSVDQPKEKIKEYGVNRVRVIVQEDPNGRIKVRPLRIM